MANPYARAAGRGCLGSVLQVVLVMIVVPVVFGVPIAIAAVVPVDPEIRLLIGAVGVLVMLGLFVVLALGFAMLRTGALDAGFDAIGVRGRGFIPNLREYHGTHAGRPLDALYARRGGTLEISLGARTTTKVAIAKSSVSRAARELFGLSTMPPHPDPALAELVIAAADARWVNALLLDPEARAAVLALIDDPSGREVRWVFVRPGAVRVTRRWIDPDAAAAGIPDQAGALARLANASERIAPPAISLAPGRFEGAFRRSPTAIGLGIVLAILALTMMPVVCLIGAIVVAETR